MGDIRDAYTFWSENLKGRYYSEDRRRWENYIRMDRKEIVRDVVDCLHVIEDKERLWALLNTVMNFPVP
jgi:hypothetical protein